MRSEHPAGSGRVRRVGFPGDASVQTREFTALPHGSVTPQVIGEGTIIMVDGGCTVEGYKSDITRTFVLGKATDKMKRVFGIVCKAQEAALKAAKPGAPLESIDAAAREVIVKAGYERTTDVLLARTVRSGSWLFANAHVAGTTPNSSLQPIPPASAVVGVGMLSRAGLAAHRWALAAW